MSLKDPVSSTLQEMQENARIVEDLARALPGVIRIDPNGRVDLRITALAQDLDEVFARRQASLLFESVTAYAAGGALPLDGGNVMVPWRALEETVALTGGAPENIRRALGVRSLAAGTDIAQILHESYPLLEEEVFTDATAALLTHGPRTLAGARLDDDYPFDRHDPDPDTPPIERGGAPLPPTPPSKDDYLSIASCVLAGAWGPYYTDPVFNSGWCIGFRVCIPYDCADALARALLEWFVPGKIAIGKAFITALVDGSVSAGLQSLASVAGFWLAAAAFATGFQMQTANLYSGGKGVCIHFPWPGIPLLPVWSSSQ